MPANFLLFYLGDFIYQSTLERLEIFRILLLYLDADRSRIVKVCSIQTLADLAERDESIKPVIVRKLQEVIESGSPAVANRVRKLLPRLS